MSNEAALLERIEILEDEVHTLRKLNQDIGTGIEGLRNAGMNADRKLMEVSMMFAYLLVTKHGGKVEFPCGSLESWGDQMDSKVVVAIERDPSTDTYRAKALTREEAKRLPRG